MSEKIRAAIIGGSEDGKTFLASGISRGLWKYHGYRTVAFDPYRGETDWGPQAKVIGPTKAQVKASPNPEQLIADEFARFRRVARGIEPHQKIAIFWDEGTDTGGRDRDNTGLFTAVRHNTDFFFFIGHSFTTMLPTMRGSVNTLFLAACDRLDAEPWARRLVDPEIMRAAEPSPDKGGNGLRQYEFIHKRKHHPMKILRYSAEQIKAGIIL